MKQQTTTAEQKARLRDVVAPAIARRAKGKNYLELLREFGVGGTLPSNATADTIRKSMKKAMTRFHPDRARNVSLRELVEREETFMVFSDAYKELCDYCQRINSQR